MKLSKETVATLKYLAGVNQNLLIQPGNLLKTISPQKNVLAFIEVPDSFDTEFAIYDLSAFLGAYGLFTDPEVIFDDKKATIKEGRNAITFYAANKEVLHLPPAKNFTFPASEITVNVSGDLLAQISKTASVLRVPDVSIVGDGSGISIVVSDLKNSAANKFVLDLDTPTTKTFSANFKVASIQVPSGDYTVDISSKKITRWSSGAGTNVYVTLDLSSTFE